MQSYVSLAEFKGEGVANLITGRFDDRLLPHLEAVSRHMETLVGGRQFYPLIASRYFSGNGRCSMLLPWDLISVTTLKEDENRDATFETTWASTDYELVPYDSDPTSLTDPSPYWKLEVNQRSNGTKSFFGTGQKRFELTGKFGYCEMVKSTGAVINEGAQFSSSDTELTVDDGSLISVGDTLVIESEYLYVSDEPVSEGNTVTVVRGVHGSTAAAHADGTAISKLVYPEPLVQATVMEAARLWGRSPSGYDMPEEAMPEGQKVLQLLKKFRKYAAV